MTNAFNQRFTRGSHKNFEKWRTPQFMSTNQLQEIESTCLL